MKYLVYIGLILSLFSCSENLKNDVLVSNLEELKNVIKKSNPGDVIIMKNGVWEDADIEFAASGLPNSPIILKAETPGGVTLEGQSYLKISGHFLEVHDLYFKNGYTPINSVIQFKKDEKNAAYDCKVVNCVIRNYTQLDRMKKDHWVEFWGQRNELLSCYLAGKSNNGPTIRVELKGNHHSNCHHIIANNYFGPRPRRGGPRGETMQIGDSYTSMVPAFIQVKNNLFDSCNGEVEVISSKSNYNKFSNNIFNKCEGSLVLRHGNYATIDSNWFIGDDNSDNIGGIRVINTGHWITNNYFYNLKGKEFRSPLAVMNGIPKSPLNRYNQVTDVVVAHNTWVNCITPLQFSVGSNVAKKDILPKSEIRSALPIRTTIANNIIYGAGNDVFKFHDKPGDIEFSYNYVEGTEELNTVGFVNAEIKVKNDKTIVPLVGLVDTQAELLNGFDFSIIKKDILSNNRTNNQAGAICFKEGQEKHILDFSQYGPHWYSPNKKINTAKSVSVKTTDEFLKAINKLNNGDTIVLNTKVIQLDQSVHIQKSVVITSDPKNKADIYFSKNNNTTAITLGPGVDLKLENIHLIGDASLNFIQPNESNMSIAANIFINNCDITEFKSIYQSFKGSFADTIQVVNSSLTELKKGFILNSEIDAKGDYNAEFLILQGNHIVNIQNEFVDFYRGGYDESTIGGNFIFENNTVEKAGKAGSKEILLQTHGIINVKIANNSFSSIKSGLIARLWGEKNNEEFSNTIKGNSKIITEEFLAQKLMY